MTNSDLFSIPFAESYWVLPGKYLAGEYPGGFDESSTLRRLQALIKCNVSSFFDLTEKGDALFPYEQLLLKEASEYEHRVTYRNFPIADFTAPDRQLVRQILDAMDEEISVGNVIYTHCIAGRGRTGTITGCYLVRHGLTGEQALEQIMRLREGMPSWWKRSPEDPTQVELVLSWKPGM